VRFWWVNHKQTFRHEFDGEYVWAPKRKRNGSRNRYYDFLREIVPGDLVFSYAHAQIQGVGIASSYCYTCPRPAEFGHIGEVWDVIGWRVDVKFRRFSRPVRPKEHIDLIERLVQRERWSPLKASGEGLQHLSDLHFKRTCSGHPGTRRSNRLDAIVRANGGSGFTSG
jgi:putative restriction endonuclease